MARIIAGAASSHVPAIGAAIDNRKTGQPYWQRVFSGFEKTKELIAGYWVIQVKSRDEAIEWARRVPFQEGEVELRQVFEAEDFGEEFTPELREQEDRLREQIEKRQGQ